jgi:hypothetical protein
VSGQVGAEAGLLEAVSGLQELAELAVKAAELAQRVSRLRAMRVQLRLPEAPSAGGRFEVALRRRVDVEAFHVDTGTWKWLGTAAKAVLRVEEGRVTLELHGEGRGSQERVFWVQLDELTLGELLALARSLDGEDWRHIVGELRRIHGALAEHAEQLERAAAAVKLVL